jgi:hypothetical protein
MMLAVALRSRLGPYRFGVEAESSEERLNVMPEASSV